MIPKQQARNKFPKTERLCSLKAISELYTDGEAFLAYPIRCVYRTVKLEDAPLRVLISVPKRHHKHAVDRNLLKRRIREAYRLNRTALTQATNTNGGLALEFSLTYIAHSITDFHTIENAVKKILAELGNRSADLHRP